MSLVKMTNISHICPAYLQSYIGHTGIPLKGNQYIQLEIDEQHNEQGYKIHL